MWVKIDTKCQFKQERFFCYLPTHPPTQLPPKLAIKEEETNLTNLICTYIYKTLLCISFKQKMYCLLMLCFKDGDVCISDRADISATGATLYQGETTGLFHISKKFSDCRETFFFCLSFGVLLMVRTDKFMKKMIYQSLKPCMQWIFKGKSGINHLFHQLVC